MRLVSNVGLAVSAINLVLLNDPTQNRLPLETSAKAVAGRM